jgi:hypothetical protein
MLLPIHHTPTWYQNLEGHISNLHTMKTLNCSDVSNINEITKLFFMVNLFQLLLTTYIE